MKWYLIGVLLLYSVFFSTPATTYALSLDPTFTYPFDSLLFQHGSRQDKTIALTFDADMTPDMVTMLKTGQVTSWYNKEVIDILEKTNTQATLFITGLWAETYPDVTYALSQNPLFEIGNHSYSHPSLGGKCYGLRQIPLYDYEDEIFKTQTVLKDITGTTPTLFRFPGGCYNEFSMSAVTSVNLLPVGWDVVSTDSFNLNAGLIENSIMQHVQPGSIIVMHMHGGPFAPKTADALEYIIPLLQTKGYTFVKVSDMLPRFTMGKIGLVF